MKSLKSSYEQHHLDNGVTDNEQLAVIFNPTQRLIVEAPAGYGKTKTLISKIAYFNFERSDTQYRTNLSTYF